MSIFSLFLFAQLILPYPSGYEADERGSLGFARHKKLDFFTDSTNLKPSISGFRFERKGKVVNEVFGRRQSLTPETELSGLCPDVAQRSKKSRKV